MLTALGAWLGVAGLAVAILASVVCFALIAAVRRNKEGPYGASLFVGAIVALALNAFGLLSFIVV